MRNLLPKPGVCPGEGFRIALLLHQIDCISIFSALEKSSVMLPCSKRETGDLGSLVIFRDLVRLFFERRVSLVSPPLKCRKD